MIDQFTQYPIGIFTTVQPFLFGWVVAISFFISVSIVALLSKDKTKKQILLMSVGVFVIVTLLATLISSTVIGIGVVDMEVFWVRPGEVSN